MLRISHRRVEILVPRQRALFAIAFIVAALLIAGAESKGVFHPANTHQAPNNMPVTATTVTTPKSSNSPVPENSFRHLPSDRSLPILMYHYIREHNEPNDKIGRGLSVSPVNFERQLLELSDLGYAAVTFEQLINRGFELPAKPIIITFDDGYADAYTAALPALKKHNFRAVFYVVSHFVDRAGYLTGDQIRQMIDQGMEIGSHSMAHRNLTQLTPTVLERDLTESRQRLVELTDRPIISFCYPAGKHNDQVVEAVKRVGYLSATTTIGGIERSHSLIDQPFRLRRIRMTDQSQLSRLLADVGAR